MKKVLTLKQYHVFSPLLEIVNSHSPPHSFIHSLIHSCFHSFIFIHLYIELVIQSFSPLALGSFGPSVLLSFSPSVIQSFSYSVLQFDYYCLVNNLFILSYSSVLQLTTDSALNCLGTEDSKRFLLEFQATVFRLHW